VLLGETRPHAEWRQLFEWHRQELRTGFEKTAEAHAFVKMKSAVHGSQRQKAGAVESAL
jgi:hypothetical protein